MRKVFLNHIWKTSFYKAIKNDQSVGQLRVRLFSLSVLPLQARSETRKE